MARFSKRQRGGILAMAAWALLLGAAASLSLQAAVNAWLLAQRPLIEAQLAEATGGAARVADVRIVWRDLRPLLALHNLQLMIDDTGPPRLEVERARIGIAPQALLAGEVRPNRLQLAGSDIRLQEDADGWHLGKGSGDFDIMALQRLAARFEEVSVRDVALRAEPLAGILPIQLQLDTLLLRPERGGWRLNAELHDVEGSGRLSVSGVISGDAESPRDWRHSWRVAFDGTHDLATTLGRLRPDLAAPRLEGVRARGELRRQGQGARADWSATLDLQAGRVVARAATGGEGAALKRLHGVLRARLAQHELDIEVQQLRLDDIARSDELRLSYSFEDRGGHLQAARLDMAVLSPVVQALSGARPPRLGGALHDVRLRWGGTDAAFDHLSARLKDVALHGPGYSVDGLSGTLEGSSHEGRLVLPEQPLAATLERHLFTPLRMDRAAGELAWQSDEGETVLRFEEMALAIDSLRAEGGGSLRLPADEAPVLRLDMALSCDSVAHAKPFMPRKWDPKLRDYLARAIEQARVSQGRLQFAAELAPDFWDDPDTEFSIDLDVVDAAMHFHPDWPRAESLSGDVAIDAQGITIAADRARMVGLQLRDIVVAIPDFKAAVLRAEAQHRTTLDEWYGFLEASPLADRLRGLTEGTRGSGQAALDFELTLPLKERDATTAEGSVSFDGAALEVAAIDSVFNDIRGRLHFVNGAVAADTLDARLRGKHVSARLDTREGVPHLRADGRVDLADADGLVRLLPSWLRPRLGGVVPVSVDLGLAPEAGFNHLSLDIDSRALTARLPDPLGLQADSVRDPIAVEAKLAEGRVAQLDLSLPGRMALRTGDGRTQLHLGPGRMPTGAREGLHISGHADVLPLAPWLALGGEVAAAAEADDATPLVGTTASVGLSGLQLTTDALQIGRFAIPDVALEMTRNAQGSRLSVDGATRGELSITAASRPHVEARFERLRLRWRSDDEGEQPATVDASEGSTRTQVDPRSLPTVDALIGDLLLDDLRLGQLDMRVEASDAGLRLRSLKLADGMLDLQASGSWQQGAAEDGEGLQLEAELGTARIDALLSAFGYASTLSAESFRARANLRWPEMARLAQLAAAQGTLQLNASNGALAAVEPGAGRVLGLFNFFALPRRLEFDFRDVTDGGLAFDRFGGSFSLGGGDARTDDLSLEGPSLRVEVGGRVGLAAQDYDQRIRIYPDISGGLTIGGAVLGGPIGVGIALLAREIFETPIEAATRIEYRLVGPWSDPQIIPEEIATTEDGPSR